MASQSSAPTPHQQLEIAVDVLAQTIEAFALGDPPAPDQAFLRSVDRLEQSIDRLAHAGNPPPEPDRGLDRAAGTLADTIGLLVHASHANPPPDPERGLELSTLAQTMDRLIHIGDTPPAAAPLPSDPSGSLLAGIDLLTGTVVSLSDLVLVSPGPCRQLADTIDVLAHELPSGTLGGLDQTLAALAHTAELLVTPPPEPDRTGDAAIRSLAHTVDALAHMGLSPPPEPDRALLHSADALTHDIDRLMHAGPSNPPAPDRFLDRGIDDLAHAIGALAHALPLLDPVEDRPHVAAIDAAVHVVDVAFHFTDVAAPGAGGHPNLVPAVQSLVRAVGEIVPCIAPAPERGIVLALDTLAHTLDFAAHEGIPPEPERPLLGALDTLVHAIDALVGPSPIETVPGGALHPAGTLDLLLH